MSEVVLQRLGSCVASHAHLNSRPKFVPLLARTRAPNFRFCRPLFCMQVIGACLTNAADLQQHAGMHDAHTSARQHYSGANFCKTAACCSASGPAQCLITRMNSRTMAQHVQQCQVQQLQEQLSLTKQWQSLAVMPSFAGWQAPGIRSASWQQQHSTASLEAWLRQLQTAMEWAGGEPSSSTRQGLTAAAGNLQQCHRWCCCSGSRSFMIRAAADALASYRHIIFEQLPATLPQLPEFTAGCRCSYADDLLLF